MKKSGTKGTIGGKHAYHAKGANPAPGMGGKKGRVANKSMSWDGRKQGPSKTNLGFGSC